MLVRNNVAFIFCFLASGFALLFRLVIFYFLNDRSKNLWQEQLKGLHHACNMVDFLAFVPKRWRCNKVKRVAKGVYQVLTTRWEVRVWSEWMNKVSTCCGNSASRPILLLTSFFNLHQMKFYKVELILPAFMVFIKVLCHLFNGSGERLLKISRLFHSQPQCIVPLVRSAILFSIRSFFRIRNLSSLARWQNLFITRFWQQWWFQFGL